MKLQKLQNAVEAFDFDIYSDEHIPALGKALADHQCVVVRQKLTEQRHYDCLLYTSPSPRDQRGSRMPSSA